MIAEKRGFTLIELLVVIAIIALLLAVLIPALNAAREQANIAVCSSNLNQIMKAFELYMMNYGENSVIAIRSNWGDTRLYWMGKLSKYMGDPTYGDKFEKGEIIDVLICPTTPAKKAGVEGVIISGNPSLPGKAKVPWFHDRTEGGLQRQTIGSYGINGWIAYDYYQNPQQDPSNRKFFKKYIDVPNETPIFADCIWICGWPKSSDSPPLSVSALESPWEFGSAGTNEMLHFCMDRHRMKIDMAFKDTHVESVPLSKLWSFPWHVGFQKTDRVRMPK